MTEPCSGPCRHDRGAERSCRQFWTRAPQRVPRSPTVRRQSSPAPRSRRALRETTRRRPPAPVRNATKVCLHSANESRSRGTARRSDAACPCHIRVCRRSEPRPTNVAPNARRAEVNRASGPQASHRHPGPDHAQTARSAPELAAARSDRNRAVGRESDVTPRPRRRGQAPDACGQ